MTMISYKATRAETRKIDETAKALRRTLRKQGIRSLHSSKARDAIRRASAPGSAGR